MMKAPVLSLLLLLPVSLMSAEEQCHDWTPTDQASSPSIFLHLASGRLAARLTPYIILLILQEKHGLQVMVDRNSMDSVTEFFSMPPSSLLTVMDNHFCPDSLERIKQHMEPFTQNQPDQLEASFLSLRQGRAVNLWPEGRPEDSAYWVPDSLLQQYGGWVRKQMAFRPEYSSAALSRLAAVRSAAPGSGEVLLVGLHVRRTDYIHFAKTVLGKNIASKAFYREAMDYFEEEYPDNQVYFLAVSDDLPWVRKNLGGRSNLVLAGSHGGEAGGEEGLNPVGLDLAILAHCSHTITSQGLFGSWGAFLAGGDLYSTYGVMVREVLKA